MTNVIGMADFLLSRERKNKANKRCNADDNIKQQVHQIMCELIDKSYEKTAIEIAEGLKQEITLASIVEDNDEDIPYFD